MHILIHQCPGSEITLDNPMPLEEQRDKYELTSDNFIRNVRWFVRNEFWQILMIHDTRYNRWSVPWGKIDKGETFEQALEKEIAEELWVTILSKNYLWWRKAYMRGSKWCNAWMAHYYDILIKWVPHNNEQDKAETIEFLTLEYSEDKHLQSVSTSKEKIETKEDIYNHFPGLHTLIDVLPHMPQSIEEVEEAPFHLPDHIDLEKTYQQRYDTEEKRYFLTIRGE